MTAAMRIYKILRGPEWEALQATGSNAGSAVDRRDGFVHFSTAAQAPETARRHFAGERGLWLLTLEADALGASLAWEPSRGGELFPHLYAPLRLTDIIQAAPLPLIGGAHQFPLLE